MFSLPPPATPESSRDTAAAVETCPVVHLSDSPEDFRHVLRVCMAETNLSYSAFGVHDGLSCRLISGALAVARIAHKYQMHDMLALAVKYLKQGFPDTFYQQAAQPLRCISNPYRGSIAIGVINLARLIDEPSLLPTALFACCALTSADLLKGLVHEDGSVEHLTMEDLGRCFDARGSLADKTLVLATNIFAPSVSEGCAAPDKCRGALERMLLEVGEEPSSFTDPDLHTSWIEAYETSYVLLCCERCQKMLRERDMRERRWVWSQLPEIMGVRVDNWPEDHFY
ncbi:hypothetical protein VTO73DRAFT_11721 [Trametes versicolor]